MNYNIIIQTKDTKRAISYTPTFSAVFVLPRRENEKEREGERIEKLYACLISHVSC